jgi:uncharacterized iron-regulated membrane protein
VLRPLLIIHRYTAVAVGLLVALWCLSGFVMMYQGFPDFTARERLRSLEPLDLSGCCRDEFLAADAELLRPFRIEMLRGEPVFRQERIAPIRLRSGIPLETLTQAQMIEVASSHASRLGITASPHWRNTVHVDQWTILTASGNQPAHRIALGDGATTDLYLNADTGEIFQQTTRRERTLNWFGAIPHWLYFTVLRSNGPLWSQVVIWTSVLATFLTLTGLYVGISRLRWRCTPGVPASPFRGWWYWHHMLGLVFGVLALTWVFSGLLTMNPWGLLEPAEAAYDLRAQVMGEAHNGELREFLAQAPGRLAPGEFVQLQGQSFDGRLQVLARRADGSAVRLDAGGSSDPLQADRIESVVHQLGTGVRSFERLEAGDEYSYAEPGDVAEPVYRVVLDDAHRTRLYIHPVTGAVQVVDAPTRRYRWWVEGLHTLDFRVLRQRPLWDIVTLLLLAGVTALATTGAWMALKRIRKDLSLRPQGADR